jgi:hypothetical protein
LAGDVFIRDFFDLVGRDRLKFGEIGIHAAGVAIHDDGLAERVRLAVDGLAL